jgi:hypothetical protein
LEISARTVLVPIGVVRARRGVDDDSVLAMVDNARHPNHLRFVFDFNGGNRLVREFRFWAVEVESPEKCAKLTIDEVVKKILGDGQCGSHKEFFRRGEIIIQWGLTHPHVVKLVNTGELRETGKRLLRSSLARFLKSRWVSATQAGGGRP